jgi:predicted nucleotidyltransferase
MEPDATLLNDLVQRILEVVQPLRIILFGSAARGQMGPNSDLDVLVVMPDGADRKEIWKRVYLNLFGLGVAKDLLIATESEMRKHAENRYLIYYEALTKGRDLYHAAA